MRIDQIIWTMERLRQRVFWSQDQEEREALSQAIEILKRTESERRPKVIESFPRDGD